MIAQRNLSVLANRLARAGGRRIPEAVLERDYCLAWFLASMAQSPLKDVLIFKGGTALKRCYFTDYRFSEDLDFTLRQKMTPEEILRNLQALYANIHTASGVRFEFGELDRHGHENSQTFYLNYKGPLPARNSVKVDITLEEVITHGYDDRAVLQSYPEFDDLPQGRQILAYSLHEIAIEKTVALADTARTEPRDLYDLWHLVTEANVELGHLHNELRDKLRFRGKAFEGIEEAITAKEARLKRLWSTRLSHQVVYLPEFDEVFRSVRRSIRQAKLP